MRKIMCKTKEKTGKTYCIRRNNRIKLENF